MNLNEIITSLHGWCDLHKAERLMRLVKESNSQISCELGVFGGRSFIPIALAHKEKGSGFALGVDAWKAQPCLEGTNNAANDEYWKNVNYKQVYDSCQDAIEKYELKDYCDTIRMTSQSVGLMLADNILDILHQDSSHNIETITAELKLWIPKLKVGGHWVIDDCDWPEAKEGYAQLPSFGLKLIEDHIKWQIWQKVK